MAKAISKLFKTFLGIDVNDDDEDNTEFVTTVENAWRKRVKELKDEFDGKGKKSIQTKVNERAKARGIELTEEETSDIDKVLDKIESKAKETKGDENEPSELIVKNSKVFKDYENSVAIREAANKESSDKKIAELTEQLAFKGVESFALSILPKINFTLPSDPVRSKNLETQYLNEFKGLTIKVDDKGVKTFYKGDERQENEAGHPLTEIEMAEKAASKWLIPKDEAELESKDSPKGQKSEQGSGNSNSLEPKTEAEFNAVISKPGISFADKKAAKEYYLANKTD